MKPAFKIRGALNKANEEFNIQLNIAIGIFNKELKIDNDKPVKNHILYVEYMVKSANDKALIMFKTKMEPLMYYRSLFIRVCNIISDIEKRENKDDEVNYDDDSVDDHDYYDDYDNYYDIYKDEKSALYRPDDYYRYDVTREVYYIDKWGKYMQILNKN